MKTFFNSLMVVLFFGMIGILIYGAVFFGAFSGCSMQEVEDEKIILSSANTGNLVTIKKVVYRYESLESIKKLVNTTDRNGDTALHIASSGNRVSLITFLVENGANVNIKNNYGVTPLIKACRNGHTAAVKKLIDLGVNIDAKDGENMTALDHAKKRNKIAVVKFLENIGAK